MKKHLDETVAEEETRTAMMLIENIHFALRKSCVTEKGYLGIVPETAEVGDIVCMFLVARSCILCGILARETSLSTSW